MVSIKTSTHHESTRFWDLFHILCTNTCNQWAITTTKMLQVGLFKWRFWGGKNRRGAAKIPCRWKKLRWRDSIWHQTINAKVELKCGWGNIHNESSEWVKLARQQFIGWRGNYLKAAYPLVKWSETTGHGLNDFLGCHTTKKWTERGDLTLSSGE